MPRARPPGGTSADQAAFVRLEDQGLLRGQLLDPGCGTGEQTLLAASRGADATGIDISPRAIERARAKAAGRGLTARFEVAGALRLGDLGLTFDTITDSGVFHVFDDVARARYVASLASVLRDDGFCYVICFSDRQPGTAGPRRVRQDELPAAFSDGWSITSIEAEQFDLNPSGLGILSAHSSRCAAVLLLRHITPGGDVGAPFGSPVAAGDHR